MCIKNCRKAQMLLCLIFFLGSEISLAQDLNFFTELGFKNSPFLKKQIHSQAFFKEKYSGQSIFTKNPMFSLSYQNIPGSTWPSLDKHMMSGIHVSLSQQFAFPWEDRYRKDAFYQKYLSEQEKTLDMQSRLIRNIASAYHALNFHYTQKKILQDNQKTLKNIVEVARTMVSVNKMNSSQLLKIEADMAIIENQILQTKAAIQQMQANMENLCGSKIVWNAGENTNWLFKSNQIKIPDDFQVDQHPLYRNLKFLVKSEKAKEAGEKAKLFPNITLSAGYTFRQEVSGRDAGEDFISFKASMPFPVYYSLKEKHTIAAQESKRKSVSEEARQMKLMLETTWRGEKEKSMNLFQAYQNFENEVLPKYRASYEASLGSLSSGTVTLLDVLDAYRKYLDISIKKAGLFKELQTSIANLNYLATKNKKN